MPWKEFHVESILFKLSTWVTERKRAPGIKRNETSENSTRQVSGTTVTQCEMDGKTVTSQEALAGDRCTSLPGRGVLFDVSRFRFLWRQAWRMHVDHWKPEWLLLMVKPYSPLWSLRGRARMWKPAWRKMLAFVGLWVENEFVLFLHGHMKLSRENWSKKNILLS